MPLEHLTAHHAAVDVALCIHAHAFRTGMIRRRRFGVLDERGDFAVARAADADALFDPEELAGAGIGPGFGIRHVDRVVASDGDAARPAELAPLVEVVAVLIED